MPGNAIVGQVARRAKIWFGKRLLWFQQQHCKHAYN